MMRWVLIFVAGGGGSALRYLVAGWVQRTGGGAFPWGTLAVNLAGCGAIGFLASLLTGPVLIRDEYRLAILVGLLGGFTTFSSYTWETLTLADDGQWWMALANVLVSNSLGLCAAWVGARATLIIYGT